MDFILKDVVALLLQNKMQSVNILARWMVEWASNLTLTFKQSEIKALMEVCLRIRCLEDSKALSLDWNLAPEMLKEYLRENIELLHSPLSCTGRI